MDITPPVKHISLRLTLLVDEDLTQDVILAEIYAGLDGVPGFRIVLIDVPDAE